MTAGRFGKRNRKRKSYKRADPNKHSMKGAVGERAQDIQIKELMMHIPCNLSSPISNLFLL